MSPEWTGIGNGSAGGRPGLVAAVDQQSPDAAERHPADELLDVDAAVAQRGAFLVGLGDLRVEGDDALETLVDLDHAGHCVAPIVLGAHHAERRHIDTLLRGPVAEVSQRVSSSRSNRTRSCIRPGRPCQNSIVCGRTRNPDQCGGRGTSSTPSKRSGDLRVRRLEGIAPVDDRGLRRRPGAELRRRADEWRSRRRPRRRTPRSRCPRPAPGAQRVPGEQQGAVGVGLQLLALARLEVGVEDEAARVDGLQQHHARRRGGHRCRRSRRPSRSARGGRRAGRLQPGDEGGDRVGGEVICGQAAIGVLLPPGGQVADRLGRHGVNLSMCLGPGMASPRAGTGRYRGRMDWSSTRGLG